MGSHRLREKPDLGDFKSPLDNTRSKPRDPKPAAPPKPSNDITVAVQSSDDAPAATPFQLSRIYAKGWQAGMASTSDTPEFDAAAEAETLNPCQVTVERERWADGFTEAVARKLRMPGRKPVAFRASTA